MDIQTILQVTASFVLLPLLATVLFIFFFHKKEFMGRLGFHKPEVGMLLVGSLFGVAVDVPLIVSSDSLLNINLGGALIPVIISMNLIFKKKLEYWKVLLGIGIVAPATFLLSRFEPSVGIVSEFPQYLVPSVIALGLGLILLKKAEEQVPYVYTIAVMGVLIGADLFRIPMLVEEGVLGSIGGAGVMDLVYLSGLIGVVPLISVYYFRSPAETSSHPFQEAHRRIERDELRRSLGVAKEALKDQLKKSLNLFYRMYGQGRSTPSTIMRNLGMHPYVVRDFQHLWGQEWEDNELGIRKKLVTARLISRTIDKKINEYFTSLGRRVLAYLIDFAILVVPFIIFFVFQLEEMFFQDPLSAPVFLAIFSLMISIQFIYFTVLEWYFGTSIGKKLLGLEVLSDDFTEMTFMQSAARNSARYADMFLFFYLISVILIVKSPENKRIGDSIADTRVMKFK